MEISVKKEGTGRVRATVSFSYEYDEDALPRHREHAIVDFLLERSKGLVNYQHGSEAKLEANDKKAGAIYIVEYGADVEV
jgi:hypothetical protein